jgi:Mor family transcriptional regulator
MQLTLTLPDSIYDILAQSHTKGAEAAAMVAVKRYLKSLPSTTNAERDEAIADKAVNGTSLKTLAQDYGLSYIRIQQIVAKGKPEAYIRQADKTNATLRSIFQQ